MSDETKFSDEEMKKLLEIQNAYVEIQQKIGQVQMSKLKLKEQMSEIENLENNCVIDFKKIQKEEKDFVDSISKKYGDGKLDAETGIFTPNK